MSISGFDYFSLSGWGGPGGLLTLFGAGILRPLVIVGFAVLLAFAVLRILRRGE